MKEQIKIDATILVNAWVDATFDDLHHKHQTVAGDISPDQYLELCELKKKLINLITEQVYQNLDISNEIYDYSAE